MPDRRGSAARRRGEPGGFAAPRLAILALLCLASALAGSRDEAQVAGPEIGILQFAVEHDLETSACFTSGDCRLQFDEFSDIESWLVRVRAYSNLATLHWDRAIPWLIFDADPPNGNDAVAFYDAQIDAPTRVWLGAFAAHFAAVGRGYLAASEHPPLDELRRRIRGFGISGTGRWV